MFHLLGILRVNYILIFLCILLRWFVGGWTHIIYKWKHFYIKTQNNIDQNETKLGNDGRLLNDAHRRRTIWRYIYFSRMLHLTFSRLAGMVFMDLTFNYRWRVQVWKKSYKFYSVQKHTHLKKTYSENGRNCFDDNFENGAKKSSPISKSCWFSTKVIP